MVLAPGRRSRDAAAAILHAHGAEFVGFYGRWAYEALPSSLTQPRSQQGQAYEINIDGETTHIHLHEGTAARVDPPGTPGVVTEIGPGLLLVSWPRAVDTATVHVIDVDRGLVYASIVRRDDSPRHVKGTIALAG